MKKIIILSIVLILAISLMAFAKGAEKIVFIEGEAWDGYINGFVIVNPTPDGATTTTIQIQVRDAIPEHEYWVYSGGQLLGTFETNKKGHGGMHCNLPFELLENEKDLGKYINIWNDEGGTSPEINTERVLRAKLPK